ncbi:hypothetical protein DV736_g5488, partial [Chaetothyriales sp. CBS 134916]
MRTLKSKAGLAVGSNGDIIVTTVFPNASLYVVSEISGATSTATHIHTFEGINTATGIIETSPGVFAFIGANQTHLGFGVVGTFGIWQLDLRPTYTSEEADAQRSNIRLLVPMPEAGFLIGLRALPDSPSVLLVTDTIHGVIWRVDTVTGEYKISVQSDAMLPPAWAPIPFGIDGIHIHGRYLYWNSPYLDKVHRIKMLGGRSSGFPAPGAVHEPVGRVRALFLDQLSLGHRNEAYVWIANNANNQIVVVSQDGDIEYVAGAPDEMTVAGATSVAFGVVASDTDTLYVSTNGPILNPVNGSLVEGGKLLAVDTTAFGEKHSEVLTTEKFELM